MCRSESEQERDVSVSTDSVEAAVEMKSTLQTVSVDDPAFDSWLLDAATNGI